MTGRAGIRLHRAGIDAIFRFHSLRRPRTFFGAPVGQNGLQSTEENVFEYIGRRRL